MQIYTYRSGHQTLKKAFGIALSLLVLLQATPLAFVSNYAQASQDPNGIEICHQVGNAWSYMITPDQSSLDGHLGHGDFLYNGPVVDKNDKLSTDVADQWCEDNIPTTPTTGTLTLIKSVVNDDNGAALNTAWTLSANGATPISGASGASAVTNAVVTAGNYDLSESGGPSGYSLTGWQCTGGTMVDSDTVTVAVGGNVSCTATNDDDEPAGPTTGTLQVVKVLVNNNGGTAATSSFSFQVNGGAVTPFESDGQNDLTLATGTYSVVEVDPVGYSESYSGDCSNVVLEAGQTKTCTITNNDDPYIPATGILVVQKVVINDNGGTAATSSFSFQVNGGSTYGFDADGEVALTVATGTYSITEVATSTYSASYDNCSGVMVSENATTTCVITNNDIAPDPDPEDPIRGCTDSDAENYNPDATEDDDSCTYPDDTTSTSGGGGGGGGGSRNLVLGDSSSTEGQVLGAEFTPGLPNTGFGPIDATNEASRNLMILLAGLFTLAGLNLVSFKVLRNGEQF